MATKEPANALREMLAGDDVLYGVPLKVPSARQLRAALTAGADFVRFDVSSGELELRHLPDLIDVADENGIPTWARVPSDDASIAAVLSMGVNCITVPDVLDVDMARWVAGLCASHRSAKGYRTLASVQIESVDGVRNVDGIAAVEGIDILQSGRNDLSKSMGERGPTAPAVLAAERRVVEAAWRAGKQASLQFAPEASSIEEAKAWVEQGLRCLTIGADVQILAMAIRERLAAFKA